MRGGKKTRICRGKHGYSYIKSWLLFTKEYEVDKTRLKRMIIPSLVTREGMTVYISYLPWYETLVLVLQMDGLLVLQRNGGLVMQKDMLAA